MIAATFGLPSLPTVDATPWLRLKGVRDLTTGAVAGEADTFADTFADVARDG